MNNGCLELLNTLCENRVFFICKNVINCVELRYILENNHICLNPLDLLNSCSIMNVLGIKIDRLSKQQVLEKVTEFLDSSGQNKIFTPNPEMLVDAQKDEYFKTVLNSGDLNVCDGFGLWLAGSFRSASFRMTRIPGIELMLDICELAEKENKTVYFLGSGNNEVISNLKLAINNKFPNLKIAGSHPGLKLTNLHTYTLNYNEEENDEILHNIIMSAPDILFVAFGHGKQEKWIYENLKDLPSVKIAMGVGGSFDFISGKVKRAPGLIRKIGLEWMYRLIREPNRLPRIFKATVIFIFYFIRSVISDQRSV